MDLPGLRPVLRPLDERVPGLRERADGAEQYDLEGDRPRQVRLVDDLL